MKFQRIPGVLMLAATIAVHAEEKAAAPSAAPATPAPAAAAPEASAAVPTPPPLPDVSPEDMRKNTSYGFGFQNGRQFAQQVSQYGIGLKDIDSAEFLKGFNAAMGGKKPEVAEKDIQEAMQVLGSILEKREKEAAAVNLEAGKKFLAENGKRKEVITTKSGLQYEVLAKGGDKKFVPGAKPEDDENKQFLVNYRGTTIDGTEFDKSPEGKPVPMTLQVVPGFKEAITTMPIGAKWKLFIPSDMAYGEQRKSAEIAPNSVLVFELELVDIKDAPPAAPGGFPMPEMPQGE